MGIFSGLGEKMKAQVLREGKGRETWTQHFIEGDSAKTSSTVHHLRDAVLKREVTWLMEKVTAGQDGACPVGLLLYDLTQRKQY